MAAASAIIPFAPTDHDVVCSKKRKWFHDHPGNILYQSVLKKYYPMVETASENPTQQAYHEMTEEILEVLLDEGQGRFLAPTDASDKFCTVLTREEAARKVQGALQRHRTEFLQKTKTPKRATRNTSLPEDEEIEEKERKEIPFSPRSEDVVCGSRENEFYDHPGNEHYRSLISDRLPKLHTQERPTKQVYDKLTKEILNSVMFHREGRFLKPSKTNRDVCIALSRKDAAVKVLSDIQRERIEYESCMSAAAAIRFKPKTAKRHSVTSKEVSSDESPKKARTNSSGNSLVGRELFSHGSDGTSTCTSTTLDSEPRTSPSNGAWTFEKLYPESSTPTARNNNKKKMYGTPKLELQMRQWLNDLQLPQSVGDVLFLDGARTVEDVVLLVEAQPHLLEKLAPLDILKLKLAVQKRNNGHNNIDENAF